MQWIHVLTASMSCKNEAHCGAAPWARYPKNIKKPQTSCDCHWYGLFHFCFFVCWNFFCTIANLRIKCVTETKNVSVLFTKILNLAFYMTHTFDSEVSLHYWMIWPIVVPSGVGAGRCFIMHHMYSPKYSFLLSLLLSKGVSDSDSALPEKKTQKKRFKFFVKGF